MRKSLDCPLDAECLSIACRVGVLGLWMDFCLSPLRLRDLSPGELIEQASAGERSPAPLV